MKQTTTRETIIMGFSEMGDKFVETQHGDFETVGEAERFGYQKIKSMRWRVANRVTRFKDNNESEVSYDYLTDVIVPRDNLPTA